MYYIALFIRIRRRKRIKSDINKIFHIFRSFFTTQNLRAASIGASIAPSHVGIIDNRKWKGITETWPPVATRADPAPWKSIICFRICALRADPRTDGRTHTPTWRFHEPVFLYKLRYVGRELLTLWFIQAILWAHYAELPITMEEHIFAMYLFPIMTRLRVGRPQFDSL
jgi:hypothetical protein